MMTEGAVELNTVLRLLFLIILVSSSYIIVIGEYLRNNIGIVGIYNILERQRT